MDVRASDVEYVLPLQLTKHLLPMDRSSPISL